MIAWWVASAMAAPPRCTEVGLRDVTDLTPPAIVVLGERHGTQPDLRRAWRAVRKLHRSGPVTLALEAVHTSHQPTLDRYAAGEVTLYDLPYALDWETSWGFPWIPYRPLVAASRRGVQVVAAGPTLGPAPQDAKFPVPPGYFSILSDAMAGHPVPPTFQDRFVRSMAWRDHSIAEAAINAWSGEGFLVVVTGRGHVEGGKGVNWQLSRRGEAKVYSAVLAEGEEAPCYPGDRIWTFDPIRDLGLETWLRSTD